MMRKLPNSLYLGHASYVCSTVHIYNFYSTKDVQEEKFWRADDKVQGMAFLLDNMW